MEYLLFFIIGGLISLLSGFFGVGGGFVLTPLLLLIGFSPIKAIVTSLMFTIGTSAFGIFAHIRLKNILWKEGMIIGISGVIATQISHPFVLFLENRGWDELFIPVLYILLLSYFAISLLGQEKRDTVKARKGSSSSPSIYGMILIGLFGGFISATLGVGGGFIIVPLLITLLHFQPKKAVGTSLFAVLMIVSVGFYSYAKTIPPDYHIGSLLIIGALLGSQLGAGFTHYFKSGEMNGMLAMFYIVILTSVALKLFHLNMLGLIIIGLFVGILIIHLVIRVKGEKDRNLKSIS